MLPLRKASRVATKSWPSKIPFCGHTFGSIRTSIFLRRDASNSLPIVEKTLHRSFSQIPRNCLDQKPSQNPAFSELEWTASTDDASRALRFKQYLTTPVEEGSGKVRTTADVLLIENSRIVRSSFIYVTLIGFAVFGTAAALSQADTKSLARDTPGTNPTIKAMRATRESHELGAAQRGVDKLRKYLGEGIMKYYAQARLAYLNASDGKKAAYMIGGANVAVFVAWQVSLLALRSPRAPNLFSFMRQWFLHAPLTPRPLNRAITPITSTFSHISTMHLALNTICMLSFATGAGYYISSMNVQSGGKLKHGFRDQELSGAYHFLAFFIAAGIFSSLGSTLHAQFLQRGVLRSFQPNLDVYRISNMPGLGASGAVYSVLVVSTFADPDVRIGIIGLSNLFPFLNVEKKYGVTVLVALDIFGLLAGWRTFGHAAHLGGAAFGAAYAFCGPQVWARIRGPETRTIKQR